MSQRLATALLALTIAAAGVMGCGNRSAGGTKTPLPGVPARARSQAPRLAVDVHADTGAGNALHAPPPAVTVSLARVTPARGAAPEPPLPEAAMDSAAAVPAAPAPDADAAPRLLPPILRHPGTLVVPPGSRGAVVELDVLVDESGRVADVRDAAGDADAARLAAARRCAEAMEFYPARFDGHAVAVWCRQRFEFGAR